jgi:type 1 glutamine amidotransferase
MARTVVISYPKETKAVLKKAAAATQDADLRKQITSLLAETGSFDDTITVWQVSGPYFEEGVNASALFDKVFPPEKPDPSGAKWSVLPKGPEPKPGLLSLDKALGGNDRAAYVRTYVSSPKKQDVLLEVGSDDGVKVWLNGKVVHSNNVARPLRPCEDSVKVTLEQGWNSILMKVTQGGGEWQACARLHDLNDNPLAGLKFQAEPPTGSQFVPAPQKAAAKSDPIGDLVAKGKLKDAIALAEKTRAGLPASAPEKAELDARIPQLKEALVKKEKEDRIKEAAALLADIPKITAAMPEKPRVVPAKPRRLLVYSEAHGFRHSACVWGAKTLEIMGEKTSAFEPVITDDLAMFEPDKLQEFDAVCFNNTTGDSFLPKNFGGLPKEQQEAARKREAELQKSLLDFVASGKGFIGIHAATDCNYNWAEYGKMIGGYFWGHPWNEKVGVKLDDPGHPLCAVFQGKNFEIADEIYQFKEPYSRETQRVLLSIDTGKTNMNKGDKIHRKDGDFAVSWIKSYGKGRVFYCSLGHRSEIFSNPMILQFYLDGIQFALGDLPADTTPSAKPGK